MQRIGHRRMQRIRIRDQEAGGLRQKQTLTFVARRSFMPPTFLDFPRFCGTTIDEDKKALRK
jgi:hypothetical protein